jgi:hypothetical protein
MRCVTDIESSMDMAIGPSTLLALLLPEAPSTQFKFVPQQAAVEKPVVPSTRTRLVACSMTARMYRRCPLRVTVSMKSRGGRPLGRRIKTCLLEDLPYRGRCDLDDQRRRSRTVAGNTGQRRERC